MRLNPFPIYKDKNGKRIKTGDIVIIHNARYIKENDKLLIRMAYIPEVNLIRKIPVLYNPNCCRSCRAGWSYIWDITEVNLDELEVLGNIKSNPELLPLKPYDRL